MIKYIWKWWQRRKNPPKEKKSQQSPSFFRRILSLILFLFKHWKSVIVTILAWNVGWYMGWFSGRFGDDAKLTTKRNVEQRIPLRRLSTPSFRSSSSKNKMMTSWKVARPSVELVRHLRIRRVHRLPFYLHLEAQGSLSLLDSRKFVLRAGKKGLFKPNDALKRGDFLQKGDYLGTLVKLSDDSWIRIKRIYAPQDGFLLDFVKRKKRVNEDDEIAFIADPALIKGTFSLPINRISLLHMGQQLQFFVSAYPERRFYGMIHLIVPSKGGKSLQIEAIIDNPHYLLRAGMKGRIEISIPLNSQGLNKNFAYLNRWTCPFHPEIRSSRAKRCPICGTQLQLNQSIQQSDPLVISDKALLFSLESPFVFVRFSQKPALFRAQSVLLGPHLTGRYVVLAGLSEGMEIVENGAFALDRELQVRYRKLAPPVPPISKTSSSKKTKKIHKLAPVEEEAFFQWFDRTYRLYFLLGKALYDENLKVTLVVLQKLHRQLRSFAPKWQPILPIPCRNFAQELSLQVQKARRQTRLKSMRHSFQRLSKILLRLLLNVGHSGHYPIFEIHDKPLNAPIRVWLQGQDLTILNPYTQAKKSKHRGVIRRSFSARFTAEGEQR